MRRFIASLGILAVVASSFMFVQPSEASTRVRGYYRSSGTYVQPYYRSNSDSYRFNNYSSRGNYNPYTGKKGYKSWY